MPTRIEVIHSRTSLYKVEDSLIEGYLAFAYPGKFCGFGATMEEALVMAKVRYRNAKKRFIEKSDAFRDGDVTVIELHWINWAKDRESKMNDAHSKWGIKEKFTWSEDTIDKKQNGET